MSIFSRFAASFRGEKKSSLGSSQYPTGAFIDAMGGGRVSAGVRVSDVSAMRVAAVYACVRVLAEDIGKLKPDVWRLRADGGRERATDHPLYGILRRPNRYMTPVSFFFAMGAALGFRGNAIAIILRDQSARPVGLWPVHPSAVTMYEAEDGSLFYAVSRRNGTDNAVLRGKPMMIPDYDVMHVRGMTFDGLVGMSPLAQMREAIGIAIAGETMSGAMMANGAQPSGVLRAKGTLDDKAAARLRAQWESLYGGSGNAGKTAILEEDMQWQPLGMTSVDAQYVETRRLQIEEIARAFRVQPIMLMQSDKAATYASAEQMFRVHGIHTLGPWVERFEQAATRDILGNATGLKVDLDERNLLRGDFKDQAEYYTKALGAGGQPGWMTVNEIRQEVGLNPLTEEWANSVPRGAMNPEGMDDGNQVPGT